jgi:predicted nucleotidyltransferase component of viral defense system
MKDYVKQQIRGAGSNNDARLIVREYLQARLLESLQNSNAFASWAFVGGTALRFLYSLPRFSEDLDFSLFVPDSESKFADHLVKARRMFERENYTVSVTAKTDRVVQSAFFKFEGLLFELGLSPHRQERVSIKVELDTHPPEGAGTDTSLVRRHIMLSLLHYDKPSLLAGKLNAIMTRSYTKGRDLYDLVWYLTDPSWPEPNIRLLNNALHQFDAGYPVMTKSNWRTQIAQVLERFDWKAVRNDVSPFLERQEEGKMLTCENVVKLLLSF